MLIELLEKVLKANADELEIEYKDRREWFTAFKEDIGIGIGSLESTEAKPIFAEMEELEKTKMVEINGQTYSLRFQQSDNFGETLYRIKMKKKK